MKLILMIALISALAIFQLSYANDEIDSSFSVLKSWKRADPVMKVLHNENLFDTDRETPIEREIGTNSSSGTTTIAPPSERPSTVSSETRTVTTTITTTPATARSAPRRRNFKKIPACDKFCLLLPTGQYLYVCGRVKWKDICIVCRYVIGCNGASAFFT